MPISPESDYCLSGMMECLHSTGDIYHGAFIGRIDVDAIIDSISLDGDFASNVKGEVLKWRNSATPFQKALMGFNGIMETRFQVSEAIGTVRSTLIRNHLESESIRSPYPLALKFQPQKFIVRGRIDTALIDRTFENECSKWRVELLEQQQRTMEAFADISFESFFDDFATYEDERKKIVAQWNADTFRGGRKKIIAKDDKKKAVKVIRKGLNLFARHGQSENVNLFISGQELIINGVLYDYKIKKRNNIIQHSANPDTASIPYDMKIMSKDGVMLAAGCVYFEKTPVLDQLFALTMHVKDRESEIALLKKTNIFNEQEAIYDDKQLCEIKNIKKDEGPLLTMGQREDNYSDEYDDLANKKVVIRALKASFKRFLKPISNKVISFMIDPPFESKEAFLGDRSESVKLLAALR